MLLAEVICVFGVEGGTESNPLANIVTENWTGSSGSSTNTRSQQVHSLTCSLTLSPTRRRNPLSPPIASASRSPVLSPSSLPQSHAAALSPIFEQKGQIFEYPHESAGELPLFLFRLCRCISFDAVSRIRLACVCILILCARHRLFCNHLKHEEDFEKRETLFCLCEW